MTDKVQKIKEFLIGMVGADCCDAKTKKNIETIILPFIDSLQKEPVIQNVIAEPVGVPAGAVELANVPDRKEYPVSENLEEEPVSEELEEAAKEYSFIDGADNIEEYARYNITKYNSFKAGAKWQKAKDQSTIELAEDHAMLAGMEKMKEQMMAKAVDGKVIANGMGNPILHLWDKGRHLIGKKVKVIVVKED